MEGRPFLRRKDREALRERWSLRAGQAFERIVRRKRNQDQLVTFTEREGHGLSVGQGVGGLPFGRRHASAE